MYKIPDNIVVIPKTWRFYKKAMVQTYDPKKGPPPKPVKPESVALPIVHLRDDAGEQGAISMS